MTPTAARCGTRKGFRFGENHPLATLTDREVELIRQLNEGGMSYRTLAQKFEVAKSTIQGICNYRRR